MNQVELEHKMYGMGRHRAKKTMANNEQNGQAHNNPYMQEIYRRFVFPLAALIRDDMKQTQARRRQAHVYLLTGMDEETIAVLAIRATLSTLLDGTESSSNVRHLDALIGKSIHHEQCLQVFEHVEPALFHTLVNEYDRRLSKSERHRVTAMRIQAKAHGVELPEWGVGARQQVGAYLLERMEHLGMIELLRFERVEQGKVNTEDTVVLAPAVHELVSKITDHVIEMARFATPCVEKPRDWTSLSDGGFHTKEMRRVFPYCVTCPPSAREYLQTHPSQVLFGAINKLQSVQWRINKDMMDAVRTIAKHFDMDEILCQADFPAPPRPTWLVNQKKEEMDDRQLSEFTQWKREMAEWHTQIKLRGTKWGRFTTAMRVAEEFKDYPSIYFVYFADFRGRLYTRTTGVSPQGSDLQKALLQFSIGKKLATKEAVYWFKIAGANRFMWDKLPLSERVRKVDEHKQHFLRMAEDPISNREWQEADAPLQFLAWLFEYAAWNKDPTNFESRIAVGMDGSCNGLQNFSAMLRDEKGGKATNLVPAPAPNDIYDMVGRRTTELLAQAEPDEKGYRELWLRHGINRTVVKRSVMTLPYGSTRFSCADFICKDYLQSGKAPEFEKAQYVGASQYLSHFVWDAIAHVVVKAREAMDWLQDSSKVILSEGVDGIQWVTPSGFPVVQHYWEHTEHRIRTRLHGNTRIRVRSENDLSPPDKRRHRNGIAPNFIHSLDASHLHLTTTACGMAGIDALAMVHDDYGTHAADADKLYNIIREQFVAMYEAHDPLVDFRKAYPSLPEPPTSGNLNIRVVLDSLYFFS